MDFIRESAEGSTDATDVLLILDGLETKPDREWTWSFVEPWNSTTNKFFDIKLEISANESGFPQKWTVKKQIEFNIFSAQFRKSFEKSNFRIERYSTYSTSTYCIWESDTRPKNVVFIFLFCLFIYFFSEGYAENYASHTAEALSRVTQGALKKPNRRISVGLSQNGISLSVEDLRRRKTRIVVVGQENVGKSG